MSKPKRTWTNEDIETIVGDLLRFGVIAAAAVVMIGAALYLWRYGMSPASSYRFFSGEPADLRTVHGILRHALKLHSEGLIQFGLLMLIATPVARVAFSIFAFFKQRDYTYVIVTMIVFALLIFSLAGGGL